MSRWFLLFFAGALLSVSVRAEPVWSDQVLARVGDLTFHECRLRDDRRLRQVQCARLSVPENPTTPGDERLSLLVVRLPASGAHLAEDPLLALAGGPGQAASESFLWLDRAFAELNRRRTIYLVDQRGTGHSRGQHCDLAGWGTGWVAGEAVDYPALARRCLERFEGEPALYGTAQAVADLEAVRRALELDRWNLYGVSYGTRLAQAYMREHPDSVRTAVLDGVLPLDQALGTDLAVHSQAALERLFERCRSSTDCHKVYADLPGMVEALLAELAASSRAISYRDSQTGERKTLELSRAHLAALIRMSLYNDRVQAVLPPALAQAHRNGDFGLLARMTQRLDLGERLALGMHNSVVCAEDVPFYPEQPAPGSESSYLGETLFEGLRSLCRHWPVEPVAPSFKAPLSSDIPTLLLSGALDPITPPAFAERVGRGLSQSVHRVVPGRAHHVGREGCVPRLIARFVDSAEPDQVGSECLSRLTPAPLWPNLNAPGP